MHQATNISTIDLHSVPPGSITRYWLELVEDGMGVPINLPLIVAKGKQKGPIVGVDGGRSWE